MQQAFRFFFHRQLYIDETHHEPDVFAHRHRFDEHIVLVHEATVMSHV